MHHEIVELNNLYPNLSKCLLEIYIPNDVDFVVKVRPAMLIIPGGGYEFCSEREKDPVALAFMLKGYACFSLTYSVTGDGSQPPLFPQPQLQAIAAIDYIKKNAERLLVFPDQIYLVGFSAGGHLAGTIGYLYKDKELLDMLGLHDVNLKPQGICLSYPVITLKEKTHGGSMEALTNGNPFLLEKLSIENGVSEDYPQTFIWATLDDDIVSIENSYLMDDMLEQYHVRHKLVMFKNGGHGLSIATNLVCFKTYPDVSTWVEQVYDFFTK